MKEAPDGFVDLIVEDVMAEDNKNILHTLNLVQIYKIINNSCYSMEQFTSCALGPRLLKNQNAYPAQ